MRAHWFGIGLVVALIGFCRAEIAPRKVEEMQSDATHIVLGEVKWIGTNATRDTNWERSTRVVEIRVTAVEKGERVAVGDAIYGRVWNDHWIGQGSAPPHGSGHWVPKPGDTVRAYLEAKDGGYDVLLPNGIVVLKAAKKP
jgi:hypothetical protein